MLLLLKMKLWGRFLDVCVVSVRLVTCVVLGRQRKQLYSMFD